MGDPEKAEARLRALLSTLETHKLGAGNPAITATNNLAAILYAKGRIADAEAVYARSLELLKAAGKTQDVLTALHNLAAIQAAKQDNAAAEKTTLEELAVARQLHGDHHLQVAHTLDSYGVLLMTRRAATEAVVALREAVAIRRDLLKPGHRELCDSLRLLGFALEDAREYAEAETVLTEATQAMAAILLPGDSDLLLTRARLASVQVRLGKYTEAEGLARDLMKNESKAMVEGARYEWLRSVAACTLADALARRADQADTAAGDRETLLNEAEELAAANGSRLVALKPRMGPRIQRGIGFTAMQRCVAVCEIAQRVRASEHHEAELAAARARLAEW